MGFPIIADTDIPQILPTGICTYEHVVHEFDYDKIVPRCIEVRGVKVTVSEIDIPVSYSAAFEGERVRREDMHAEFRRQETPWPSSTSGCARWTRSRTGRSRSSGRTSTR